MAGEILSSLPTDGAANWGSVRLIDHSIAQTAAALSCCQLWPPGVPESLELDVCRLDDVAKLGLVHRDITGPAPRGPFDKTTPSPTATYPSLWNHNAKKETRIVCQPDSQLQVRQEMEAKAAIVLGHRQPCPSQLRLHIWLPATCRFFHRETVAWRQCVVRCHVHRQPIRLRIRRLGQQHARFIVLVVALQPTAVEQGQIDYQNGRIPPHPRPPGPSPTTSYPPPKKSSTASDTATSCPPT